MTVGQQDPYGDPRASGLAAITRHLPDLSEGLCVGHHHRDWWISERRAELEAAGHMCRRCPLLDPCRRWADEQPRLWGTWGGVVRSDRFK